MSHFVYIVRCNDDTLYTGYTVDLKQRLIEHNGDGKNRTELSAGAKYTRSRRPVKLLYSESLETRSEALSREYAIKQLSRPQKLALIKKAPKIVYSLPLNEIINYWSNDRDTSNAKGIHRKRK
jgi:putative endonuclease